MSRISEKVLDANGTLIGLQKLGDGRTYVPLEPGGAWGLIFTADGGFDCIGRKDGKFYEGAIENDVGYPVLTIVEEPSQPREKSVGAIVLVYRDDGMILARDTKCLDGTADLEAMPTSVSKGGPVKGEPLKTGAKTNLKRIRGSVDIMLYREAPGVVAPEKQRWVPIKEFVQGSGDCRSLAAVATACLDPDFAVVHAKAMQ